MVPEEVEAHDRDEGSLEPAEQPEALVEDAEVEARLLKSVEPGQRQLAEVVGIQEHRQDERVPRAPNSSPSSALWPASDTRVWGIAPRRSKPSEAGRGSTPPVPAGRSTRSTRPLSAAGGGQAATGYAGTSACPPAPPRPLSAAGSNSAPDVADHLGRPPAPHPAR